MNVFIYLFEASAGRKAVRGFTLIEMLVVMAIITFIMSIVITSQSTFNKTLILQNTAYDIALTLRSAQTFGLGSRATGVVTNAGYGVHFSTGSPNSFRLFADTSGGASCAGGYPDCKVGDHVYTTGSDTLVGQPYQINNGITVSDFCVSRGGVWSCASGGSFYKLDITFARPNPDASIYADGFLKDSACLIVSSSQSVVNHRYISIAPSGEITANATSCP